MRNKRHEMQRIWWDNGKMYEMDAEGKQLIYIYTYLTCLCHHLMQADICSTFVIDAFRWKVQCFTSQLQKRSCLLEIFTQSIYQVRLLDLRSKCQHYAGRQPMKNLRRLAVIESPCRTIKVARIKRFVANAFCCK